MPSGAPESRAVFDCRQCGDCCRGYGGTFVTRPDIEAIASFLGIDPDFCQKTYCRPSGNKLLLTQKKDGYCIFWDRLCTIHPVKPRMCRQWPFIESVLKDIANWRAMASMCPGIRASAPEDRIRHCVREALRDEGAAGGNSACRP